MILFSLILILNIHLNTLDPGRQFCELQKTPLQRLNTKMAMQRIIEGLCSNYLDLGLIQEKLKFFESCVSEGLMPNGFRGPFNLAMDVNDEAFVREAQKIMDERSSRLLDLAYKQTCKKESDLLIINT